MSRFRSQGLLAVCLGLAAAACSDPELRTDLRPEGPPDVLALLTQHPIDLTEEAVYCKYVGGQRDPKAPAFVGDPLTGGFEICPAEESEFGAAELEPRPFLTLNAAGAVIDNQPWAVRVMFDELLDADRVETLIKVDEDAEGSCDDGTAVCEGSIADTQPFTLTCGAANTEVAYRGWYTPNGNNTTFPLGPSLYVQPDPAALTFPTGSTCTLALDPNVVQDKDGVSVPEADQSFDIKIQDLTLLAVDPENDPAMPATISPDPVAAGAAAFVFNANIDPDTDPAQFTLEDAAGNPIDAAIFVGAYYSAGLTDAIYVYPNTDTGIFAPGTYTATMLPGTITEANGGTLTVTTAEETTFKVAFAKTGQSSGADFSPTGIIRVAFNNTLDPASLDLTPGGADFEFFTTTGTTPNQAVPVTVTVGDAPAALANIANNSIVIDPNAELPLGTYVMRLKAGGELKDIAGNTAKFTAPVAVTYNVLLKVRSVSANNAPLATPYFDIQFSGTLDQASVSDAEFEIIDLSNNMPVAFTRTAVTGPVGTQAEHANDTVRLDPTAALVPGRMYRVTLKAGASLTNVPPAGYNAVTRAFATATSWTFTAVVP